MPVLVQSSFYLFNSFPGRQLLSHDGTENPAGLRTLLHRAEDGGLLILLTNGLQSYCHQILEHGHLAPNEPQWWIPSWKLSFANQICNRLKNRHRLLYLQPTAMVSGLHIQVFYTRSWTPKVPSAASGCELLSESCSIGLSLLWIIIIGFELHLRLQRRSEGLKGSSISRFTWWGERRAGDRHNSGGGSLEPRLEPSWWKRFCYLWLQAQTQTTVRQYHFQTIKPLGSTDCLQNPMQRYPEKLGIKCRKHKARVQRTHREKLNRKQKYARKKMELYNITMCPKRC